jgi:hypothetical protein
MMSKRDLSATELLLLQSEMRSKERSLGLAYLMLFGGHLGLHRFYLNRKASASVQLILFIITVVLYVAYGISDGFGIRAGIYMFGISCAMCAVALTIWVIVDACLLPGMTRRWNEVAERVLIGEIVAYRSRRKPEDAVPV